MLKAYLAGPDVFLPAAAAHMARKAEICRAHGLEGVSPLGDGLTTWQEIFAHCLATMERCDIVIANLTPFRGASADGGTLVELGWFLGRGRPIFAYSNTAAGFTERSEAQRDAVPDPHPDLAIERFGLPDNLMIPGAVERLTGHEIVLPEGADVPFDDLAVFERCAARAASHARG